jgi:protein-S-isoprenylcysteine O-methyltransferase Ste14
MTLSWILSAAVALFPLSEIVLAIFRRASRTGAVAQDRGFVGALWVVLCLAVAGALLVRRLPSGRIALPAAALAGVALGLLVVGLAIRWTAIVTLGRFFTVDVAIARDHRLVQRGLYRHVRHPSYTGLLVAFLGTALAFGSWWSVLVVMVPATAAFCARIAVEERALRGALGEEYEEYCERTWRLLPGIF